MAFHRSEIEPNSQFRNATKGVPYRKQNEAVRRPRPLAEALTSTRGLVMRRLCRSSLVVVVAIALTAAASAWNAAPLTDPKLDQCIVSLIDDVEVPAQEAGALTLVEASAGDVVDPLELLARIDDKQAVQQKKIAEIERRAAEDEATNDIRVRYARSNYDVAKQDYDAMVEGNNRTEGSFELSRVREKKLAATSAELQIEQTQFEMALAAITAESKAAEVEAAQTAIERREIRAPIAGQITEVLREMGEWVQPGEPVFRIARLDNLRVEGFVRASEYSPAEVSNRKVTVEVTLERGRVEHFPGKVVFVNPLIEGDGEYRVRAEVKNLQDGDQWLLRPGHTVSMTIHLDDRPSTPPPAAAARESNRRPPRRGQ